MYPGLRLAGQSRRRESSEDGSSRIPTAVDVFRTQPGAATTVKAALARYPHARRLARRQPGSPGEPRRGRARGPKHVVTKGATLVLTPAETRLLLDRIDPGPAGRSARPGAAERAGLQLRAGERGGLNAAAGLLPAGAARVAAAARERRQGHDVPAHHRAEQAVAAYVNVAGLDDPKAPLSQSVDRAGRLTGADAGAPRRAGHDYD